MEWISIKDRLPQVYGEYLVYTDSHRLEILTYWGFTGRVTHWMSLPSPPIKESS